MLDTRQLRYFVAVADDLHFTKAADRLHVAQSSLSTQVNQLEAQLGARLLARRKRSAVSLTDAGVLFLVEARRASSRWNAPRLWADEPDGANLVTLQSDIPHQPRFRAHYR